MTPAGVVQDLGKALEGRLPHSVSTYNSVQKAAYIGVPKQGPYKPDTYRY